MRLKWILGYAGRELPVPRFRFVFSIAVLVGALTVGAAGAGPLQAEIGAIETELIQARAYLGNYPAGNNDPNPVRRRFLGIDANDRPTRDRSPGHVLGTVVDDLVQLSERATEPDDRERIDDLLNQATQLALQGWVISGNISLMEGLRVSYPAASEGQARPQHHPIPYGSLEKEHDFISVKDATRATLFYDEAARVLLTSLRRRPEFDRAPIIVDVDSQRIPSDKQDLPGAFDNHRFPQYTWYLDVGNAGDTSDDRIVPIQTPGYLMGNLLYKQGQAAQSIGYRLWTAAYFRRQAQADESVRKKLLDAAVSELHAGANTQFLSSIALAATVGDKAETTAKTPYEVARLYHARHNVKQARDTITQIRANEKPTLPIDEIMAGDAQVNALLEAIEGSGPGSIARAEKSYEAAKAALLRVHEISERVFREKQTRQGKFLHRLEELTGEPISESVHDGITPETLRTPGGQAEYMDLIAKRINALMESTDPDFGSIENRLDKAVKQVVFHRQEVLNKKAVLDSYPQRIKIIEDTLGANKSAIKTAEGRITTAQFAMGIANSVSITVSESVSVSTSVGLLGPSGSTTFSSGISTTFNPGAIIAAALQNDITRARNLKEMAFLDNDVSARIRNLLLDQDLAHGELKSQLLLLRHAEDAVNKILGDTQRILAQLRAFEEGVDNLWYNDPVWNIELTGGEEEANRDMATLVANLYKLGRLLEIRWVEPFANPVSTLGEPKPLGNDFENFGNLESVFALPLVNVRDNSDLNSPPEQARDFLDALKAWDQILRRKRIFEGDLPVFHISLRQDVFGLADVKAVNGSIEPLDLNPNTNPGYAKDEALRRQNIRRFQNILLNHVLYKQGDDPEKRGFLLKFPLRYHKNGFTNNRLGNTRLFGAVNAWNYRLDKFRMRICPDKGKAIFFPPHGPSEIQFIFAQAGTVENVDFFERSRGDNSRLRTYNLDNYVRYNESDLNSSEQAPYMLFSSVTKLCGEEALEETTRGMTLKMAPYFWSPFASRWLLQVVPTNGFAIENIEDIWIDMHVITGRPSPPKW